MIRKSEGTVWVLVQRGGPVVEAFCITSFRPVRVPWRGRRFEVVAPKVFSRDLQGF